MEGKIGISIDVGVNTKMDNIELMEFLRNELDCYIESLENNGIIVGNVKVKLTMKG